MIDPRNLAEIDVVARTLWGEARGEPERGKEAVCWVIRNRAERGGRFGATWKEVCLKPYAFSCWNRNDPQREKLLAFKEGSRELVVFRGIAAKIRLLENEDDPTGGADHYHAAYIDPPPWTAKMTQTASIGRHLFYREKPLSSSRTVKGGQAATVGTVGTAAIEAVDQLEPVKDTLGNLAPYLKWAAVGFVVLTLIGIGVMIWARVDDRQKGLR